MTNHDTEPAVDAQRRGHMAAMSVAEHLLDISPIMPSDVKTACAAFEVDKPSIDLFFYNSPEGVRALADVLGVDATAAPHSESDSRTFTSMQAMVSGVPVRAWSLGGPGSEAVSR
ncbi:hypothetical protein [Streptomyces triculaminicus]|uniref:hypothetical protein n=1 Tax=Streptomyces triculaminicus TaxID=2816232 RepID=UPI00378C84E2